MAGLAREKGLEAAPTREHSVDDKAIAGNAILNQVVLTPTKQETIPCMKRMLPQHLFLHPKQDQANEPSTKNPRAPCQ